jgi:hypothetical protein
MFVINSLIFDNVIKPRLHLCWLHGHVCPYYGLICQLLFEREVNLISVRTINEITILFLYGDAEKPQLIQFYKNDLPWI